jgi:hypothetical protein
VDATSAVLLLCQAGQTSEQGAADHLLGNPLATQSLLLEGRLLQTLLCTGGIPDMMTLQQKS